uniref:Pyrroline-5-carboxylate reductase catalytic N-terminal domain-containing protein n=1 Tax=Biomphalaria glabrata TaxID=6526 RepID=A0A2C9KAN4_BIOGL
MAQAMSNGFISSGLVHAKNIYVSDSSEQMLEVLAGIGVNTTKDNTSVVEKSDLIVIAVKPNIVSCVLKEVAPVAIPEKHLFVQESQLYLLNLPPGTRVDKVMPNTPDMVQAYVQH